MLQPKIQAVITLRHLLKEILHDLSAQIGPLNSYNRPDQTDRDKITGVIVQIEPNHNIYDFPGA
jgi:hypothetical protein